MKPAKPFHPLTPAQKKTLLLETSSGILRAEIERHFLRLDADYWIEFPIGEIREHLTALRALNSEMPYWVRLEDFGENRIGLTVIGGDFPGFFAAVTGFLAAGGYDIRAGKAFTFLPDPQLPALPRGGVVDFFLLERAGGPADDAERDRLKSEMENLFRRFADGEADAIRTELFLRMGMKLETRSLGISGVPLDIRTHALDAGTQIVVRGRDREGMLFCMAAALSLQGWSIEKLLTASPEEGWFEDRVTVTGPGRRPIGDARDLEKIRAGIALMERLLETLPVATDLQAAAEGLRGLVEGWLDESSALSPSGALDVLPALSRVLTAGPRMWETVSRLGPRAFRALLSELARETEAPDRARHQIALEAVRAKISKPNAVLARARAYRDRELLKSELDLLLTPARDLDAFGARLQALAEALLVFSVDVLREELEQRHGPACPFALFALGKFGGEELGSGSDLEILLIYVDSGETSGSEPLRHWEFYERLCRALIAGWETSAGETLALDLRLRPHGESGPLAAGAPVWEEYFASGEALDYEKQALIRLRCVHGDAELSRRILARRDAVVFTQPPVPIAHTMELHARQMERHGGPGGWNAKYSAGGLVEFEYALQFLQLAHGARKPVRQTNSNRALEALLENGVVTLAEFEHLFLSHLFLRRLINALRLARGARDLHCPSRAAPEFSFLSKRMGYASRPEVSAEIQLERDLRQAQRVVGGFFRHRFLAGERPDWLYASIAEALMDPEAEPGEATPALQRLGMRELPLARGLFLDLFDLVTEKRLAAACLLACEGCFRRSPDPEGVLRKLVRHLGSLASPDLFIRQALHHPELLEMLLLIFANSEPLSDLALRESGAFKEIADPVLLEKPRLPEEFQRAAAALETRGEEPAAALCRFRNREYLRIALRDLRLHVHLQNITREISLLSDALVETAWRHVLQRSGLSGRADDFCVLALGKFGGVELNYSSDIDLVFVLDDAAAGHGGREAWERAGREFISILTHATPEGRLFRVDMNLRPWGGQGPLAVTVSQALDYFARDAGGWELQAWLKARPVCGNKGMGEALAGKVRGMACAAENRGRVEDDMRRVRIQALESLGESTSIGLAGEVKSGPGGIRTVEFFVQSLQIKHGAENPALLTGNTLDALGRLRRFQLLPENRFQLLSQAYVFLRRVEHRLQLQGLEQLHALPLDPGAMERLAKQMGFEDRIGAPALEGFLERYRKHVLSLQSVSAELFGH